ncbi:MAG: hypothetical protein ACOYT4_00920, partial [Nanoarchaeota archaeon]
RIEFTNYSYCGDGICNAEETCEICSEDCGSCYSGSGSSSGGGSFMMNVNNTESLTNNKSSIYNGSFIENPFVNNSENISSSETNEKLISIRDGKFNYKLLFFLICILFMVLIGFWYYLHKIDNFKKN